MSGIVWHCLACRPPPPVPLWQTLLQLSEQLLYSCTLAAYCSVQLEQTLWPADKLQEDNTSNKDKKKYGIFQTFNT